MEIIPVKNFIILELPQNAASKIIHPENVKDGVVEIVDLIVVRKGPLCKKIKIGDKIVVDCQAIVPFKIDNKKYFLTREDNVGCIIR
jgi:co-chaperonin GroES (HSP10)